MLAYRSEDICCVQETRFRRKSFWVISWKAAEYKLFWIGRKRFRRSKNFLGQERCAISRFMIQWFRIQRYTIYALIMSFFTWHEQSDERTETTSPAEFSGFSAQTVKQLETWEHLWKYTKTLQNTATWRRLTYYQPGKNNLKAHKMMANAKKTWNVAFLLKLSLTAHTVHSLLFCLGHLWSNQKIKRFHWIIQMGFGFLSIIAKIRLNWTQFLSTNAPCTSRFKWPSCLLKELNYANHA